MSSTTMLTCSTCGNEEPEGSHFCGSCGTPFQSTVTSSALTLTCASCSNEEAAGSQFCGNCGSPFPAADPQPHPAPTEASTSVDVPAPASADAPTEIAPLPVEPHAPTSPVRAPPPAATRPTRSRRRLLLFAVVAGFLVLLAAGAAAVLFGTDVIGSDSAKSDSAFVSQVNGNVLGPLARADEAAAQDARTSGDPTTRASDGGNIVRVAEEASLYLRSLSGLSGQQQGQVQLLLALVASNRLYGQAFAAFTPADMQSQLALDGAAAAARASIASTESSVSSDLELPSQAAFISLRSPTPPPQSSTTTTTPPPSNLAAVYVQQVDGLLGQSHAVVLSLRSFVPRAGSDAISRSAAVAQARSYVDERRLELARMQALTVPSSFALAQRLLVRSLQVSVADDEALVAWTVARRDGSGNAKAALDRANRIGARATALKKQFLRAYGQQRQAATGLSPASLPDIF